MKYGKGCRRVLTALLAVAVVFQSVFVTTFVSQAATNAYEATSGTHGATYDATTNQVTFFVNNTDAFYGQVEHMWYKEFASYEEAAAAHIVNGGNFIVGVGATAMTANADGTQKTASVTASEGTGAIIYYINAGAGHPRPDYEHIIVLDNGSTGETETPDEDGTEEGTDEEDGTEEGTGEEGGTEEGTGEEGGTEDTVVEGAIVFDNVEKSFYRSQDDGGWAGDSNATISYNGTTATVSADSFGWNAWGLQWKLLGLTSAVENNVFAFDVVSTINKNINVKNETSGVMETISLVAGETYHYEATVTGTTIDITFDLVGGEGKGSLTFTNMTFGTGSVIEDGDDDNGNGEETPDSIPAANTDPLNFEELTITTYRSQDDGSWAGDSNVEFTYSGSIAQITADNFGWNAWGIQWLIKNLTSSVDDNVFEFDVVSSIDKNIVFKNEETGTTETITLEAGKTTHFACVIAGKTLNATFDLTGGAAGGTLTFTNMKFGTAGVIEVAPTVIVGKAMDKANGYKVGENVVLNYNVEATAWVEKISAVKVNNQVIDTTKYTVAEGALTIDSSVFTKEYIYTIEIEANGYNPISVKLPVYDADVAEENWSVAWEDQFNSTELDTTKWSYEIGIQSGEDGASSAPTYWGNNEKQYYIEEAVEVKDGYLVITGDKLTQDVKNQYNVTDTTVQYTSGRIRTVTDSGEVLAATTYGRIEAKMSLPAGDGYWPAFWMLPTSETCELYGVWASSGELDIMEAVGQNPTQINGTIHYGGSWPNNVNAGGTYTFPNGGSIADEHLYAVEWEPGEIRWYVDDVLYHVENNWYGMDANGEKYSYPAPFDEDFYILFNLAMSGNYVANVMPTEMGKQMKVDYVRILVDENTDYKTEVTTPSADRDASFFEANGGYVDLIQDKDYTTLASHAYGDGANVIPGIGYWSSAVNTNAGAAATVEVIDGVAKIDVTKLGSNDYNIQLIQNIPLAKGYTYRITFDAWTDLGAGRGITVAPKGDADNAWKAYDAGINAALTTTGKTFTYEFLMTGDSDPTARLEMNLGGAIGSVYIDNVSVIALTDAQLEGAEEITPNAPLADGEHIYNGSFDKGEGKLGNWIVEGSVGNTENRDYTVTVGAEGTKLIQKGVQLLSEDTYKLTFDAKTIKAALGADDTEAKIRATVKNEAQEVVYVSEEFVPNTELSTYGVEFTIPVDMGTGLGTVEFEFVGLEQKITIDNVSLKRLTNVHMEWDAYEFYPMGEDAMSGFTTYDEVWTWAVNPINVTEIGNGERALAVNTTPVSESWKVMLQKENIALSKGMSYNIKFAIKASVDNQTVEVKIEDNNYSPCYKENIAIGTEWTYVDADFVSTLAGAGALKFCLASVNQDCTIYVKDVSMELAGVPTPQFVEGAEVTEVELNSATTLNIEHSVKVQEKYHSFAYESSDDTVLEVSKDGVLTAKALGRAEITVTSVLGTKFSFTVTVVEAAEVETPGTEEPSTEESKHSSGNSSSSKPSSSKSSSSNAVKIEDAEVPMAEQIVEAGEVANVVLVDKNAVLKLEVMSKYYGRNMYVMAHLGNGIGYSIENSQLAKATDDVALGTSMEKLDEFAEGFNTFYIKPVQTKQLSYEVGLHVNVGAEFVGKTAYLFSKSLVTGSYELIKVMTVNEIGNVAMYMHEMTEVMVLIEE